MEMNSPVCLQKAEWYLRRHEQELELLMIGSDNMHVELTEGVSSMLRTNGKVASYWNSLGCL